MRQIELCCVQTIIFVVDAVETETVKFIVFGFVNYICTNAQLPICTFVGFPNSKWLKSKHFTCSCSWRHMDNISTRPGVQFSVSRLKNKDEDQFWYHSQAPKVNKYGLLNLKKYFFCRECRLQTSIFQQHTIPSVFEHIRMVCTRSQNGMAVSRFNFKQDAVSGKNNGQLCVAPGRSTSV